MTKFITKLLKDESGTAVTEWIVAASIMAIAGIMTFSDIASQASIILTAVKTGVTDLAGEVTP
jgi:Flp pilus assembly pilin Flp